MPRYNVGDGALIKARFRNARGQLVDPTTIALHVEAPNGTITIYTYAATEITRTSAGKYEKAVSLTASGEWEYNWVTTGPGGSEGSRIYVRPAQV